MENSVSDHRERTQRMIKQLMVEHRNPQGALALMAEAKLTEEEIHRLLQEVVEDAKGRGLLDKKQFDIRTMRYLTLEEWIKEYF